MESADSEPNQVVEVIPATSLVESIPTIPAISATPLSLSSFNIMQAGNLRLNATTSFQFHMLLEHRRREIKMLMYLENLRRMKLEHSILALAQPGQNFLKRAR